MEGTFPGVLAFAFMAAMLYAGAILRMTVPVLQTFLIPASIIGGTLGFALINAGLGFGYSASDFVPFTFHFFTLSFMSLVLTGRPKEQLENHRYLSGGLWLALLWTMSLVLQALIGLAVITAYNAGAGDNMSAYLGIIVAHGFTQGPGQALALGTIWEANFSIDDAAKIGLIYASLGFVVSFVIGVPIARWMLRHNMNSNKNAELTGDFLRGLYPADANIPTGRHVTNASNVESLAFHLGLLGVAYLLADQWLKLLGTLVGDATLFGVPLNVFASYNLFFVHGLLVCAVIRAVIEAMSWDRFVDDDTQRMVTGASVDMMVVGTIMSIEVAILASVGLPILLVTVAVTIATAALCFGMSRVSADFGPERSIASFGCCCGSTGTGLLLLRLLDPDFRTPVARELAVFNIAIMVTTLHILFVMAPVLPSISIPTILAVYGATFVIAGIGMRLLRV